MSGKFYEINAKAGETHAEIRIYDVIGNDPWGESVSAKRFVNELDQIKADTISLHINSPGGNVFEGNTIYNALHRHPATVTAHVDGLAGSIASIVAIAADHVVMAPNALMMIHEASVIAMGNAEDMRQTADTLDRVSGTLVAAYVDKTGKSADEVRAAMRAETWFSAEEAVAWGLADEVAGENVDVAALAHFDASAISKFRHAPAELIAALHAPRVDGKRATPEASTGAVRVDHDAVAARELRIREIMMEG
jgi:ATP-dependent protease ClpP protease subunit